MLGSSWVTTTNVIPFVSRSFSTRSSSADEEIGSSPALGSSRNTISGSSAIARAIAARFFMPPEISLGSFSAASASPTSARSDIARSRRSARLSRVNSSSGSITFSRHVIAPKSAPDWYITPILWKSASRVFVDHSIPATRRVPARIGLSPIMCFIIVDLPQPDPPRRMNTSPRFTSNETSRRITAPGYPASTCSSSIIEEDIIMLFLTQRRRVAETSISGARPRPLSPVSSVLCG